MVTYNAESKSYVDYKNDNDNDNDDDDNDDGDNDDILWS